MWVRAVRGDHLLEQEYFSALGYVRVSYVCMYVRTSPYHVTVARRCVGRPVQRCPSGDHDLAYG